MNESQRSRVTTWEWDENENGLEPEVRLFVKVRGVARWMWIRNDEVRERAAKNGMLKGTA